MKNLLKLMIITLLVPFLGYGMGREETTSTEQRNPQSALQINNQEFQRQHFFQENNVKNLNELRAADGHQEGDQKGFSTWTKFSRAIDRARHTVANKLGWKLENNPKTVLEEVIDTNVQKFKNNFKKLPQSNIEELHKEYAVLNPFERLSSDEIEQRLEVYTNKINQFNELPIVKQESLQLNFLENENEKIAFTHLKTNKEKLEFLNEYAKQLEATVNNAENNLKNYYTAQKIQLDSLQKALKIKITNLKKSSEIQEKINNAHWSTRWAHQLHKKLHDWSNNVSYSRQESSNDVDSIRNEIQKLTETQNKVTDLLTKLDNKNKDDQQSIKNHYKNILSKIMTNVDSRVKPEQTLRYNQTTHKFELHTANIAIADIGNLRDTLVQDRLSPIDNQQKTAGPIPTYTSSNIPSKPNINLDDLVTIIQDIQNNDQLTNQQKDIAMREAISQNKAYNEAFSADDKNTNKIKVDQFLQELQNKIKTKVTDNKEISNIEEVIKLAKEQLAPAPVRSKQNIKKEQPAAPPDLPGQDQNNDTNR